MGLLFGLAGGIWDGLATEETFGAGTGLYQGVGFGVIYGLYIGALSARYPIKLAEVVRWSWPAIRQFSRTSFTRLILLVTALVWSFVGVLTGQGVGYLFAGLIFGLLTLLLIALFTEDVGLQIRLKDDDDRIRPDQG